MSRATGTPHVKQHTPQGHHVVCSSLRLAGPYADAPPNYSLTLHPGFRKYSRDSGFENWGDECKSPADFPDLLCIRHSVMDMFNALPAYVAADTNQCGKSRSLTSARPATIARAAP